MRHKLRTGLPSGGFPTICLPHGLTAGGGGLLIRWITVAMIGTIAGLGLAASASAQNRPYVNSPPATNGDAIVGKTLTSVGGQAGGPPGTTVGRAWLRCTNAT